MCQKLWNIQDVDEMEKLTFCGKNLLPFHLSWRRCREVTRWRRRCGDVAVQWLVQRAPVELMPAWCSGCVYLMTAWWCFPSVQCPLSTGLVLEGGTFCERRRTSCFQPPFLHLLLLALSDRGPPARVWLSAPDQSARPSPTGPLGPVWKEDQPYILPLDLIFTLLTLYILLLHS